MRDLDHAIGIDSDSDGIITWGELRVHHPALAAYALSHLRLAADGNACAIRPLDHLIDEHSDGAYEVLRFAADCPGAPQLLNLNYTLLFDVDPPHRGLLRLEEQGRVHRAVFNPDHDYEDNAAHREISANKSRH